MSQPQSNLQNLVHVIDSQQAAVTELKALTDLVGAANESLDVQALEGLSRLLDRITRDWQSTIEDLSQLHVILRKGAAE